MYPTLKGFDNRGLYRMMQFYDTYKDDEIVAPLVRQNSWSNNIAEFTFSINSLVFTCVLVFLELRKLEKINSFANKYSYNVAK